MKFKKFDICIANLKPAYKSEPGKKRPGVIVQIDALNNYHPSTIVCPITTNIQDESTPIRVRLSTKQTNLKKESDILVDQIRAIDNSRIKKVVGSLRDNQKHELIEKLKVLIVE